MGASRCSLPVYPQPECRVIGTLNSFACQLVRGRVFSKSTRSLALNPTLPSHGFVESFRFSDLHLQIRPEMGKSRNEPQGHGSRIFKSNRLGSQNKSLGIARLLCKVPEAVLENH